jgi:hypothetical protein
MIQSLKLPIAFAALASHGDWNLGKTLSPASAAGAVQHSHSPCALLKVESDTEDWESYGVLQKFSYMLFGVK